MKRTTLTIAVAVLLMICSNGILAQTTPVTLNQVELMKQFLGNWKVELGKDTIQVTEILCFRNGGFELYSKYLYKDKIYAEHKYVCGYDKKNDKHILAVIMNDNPSIGLTTLCFTSKTTCDRIPYTYISNPEQAASKTIYEFKSPDQFIANDIKNGKPIKTIIYNRVK
jgi:hypothetical protein